MNERFSGLVFIVIGEQGAAFAGEQGGGSAALLLTELDREKDGIHTDILADLNQIFGVGLAVLQDGILNKGAGKHCVQVGGGQRTGLLLLVELEQIRLA